MALPEELCIKVCETLLERSIIPDKNVLDYKILYSEDTTDVILKISTEEDDYNFTLNISENSEQNDQNDLITIIFKDVVFGIEVKNISIDKYSPTNLGMTDLTNLELNLKSLAFKHSRSIRGNHLKGSADKPIDLPCLKDYKKFKDILVNVMRDIDLKGTEENFLNKGIDNLVNAESLKSTKIIYVPGYITQNRLIFKNQEEPLKKKILNIGQATNLPLPYDVLLTIFLLSDQKLRQNHFCDLLDYYYRTLYKVLDDASLDLSTILPSEEFQIQIKTFIPYVKLEITYKYCQEFLKCTDGTCKMKCLNQLQVAISELYECCLYKNLNREDCYKIVRNEIGSSNYEILNWSLTQLEQRAGFLGDYFKLKIQITHNGNNKTLNLFAKYLPTTNDTAIEMASESFNKEEFFYSTFLPEVKALGFEEITDFLPKCYFSRSNDVLIFEDLSLKNYRALNKKEPFSYTNMRLIIKQLAKLHACSFLYEEKMSEKYGKTFRIDDKYQQYLHEINLKDTCKITICGVNTFLTYIIDAFPDIPQKMSMETFKEKVKKIYQSFYLKVGKCDRFRNVLCQADFWGSNIMFKMKDNTPVDCCIIDYQLLRYCPPSHDLFFLIYANSDKESRTKFMALLLDEYYTELSKILEKYNYDLNKIYTYEQFLDSCEYMKPVGICIASLYLPITLCPEEIIQDILSDEERGMIALTVDRKELIQGIYHEGPQRQRIKEVVEDMYNICENDNFV